MTKPAMDQAPPRESLTVLERLEFGKLCVSPNGPILEEAGHALLGRSERFPADLVADCHPDMLGLAPNGASADSEGFLNMQQPYGTVVRPVSFTPPGSSSQSILRLAYRVGIRSEGGSHNPSRRYYKLGSYLAQTQGQASPLTLVRALPPLQGFVRDPSDNKTIATLQPVVCSGAGSRISPAGDSFRPYDLDPDVQAMHEKTFLQGAVKAAMSAVPIHIEAEEDVFFGLVEMLWDKLPPGPAQELLSAGWNVSSHFSGRLCVTFSHGPSSKCAYYDARGGWKTRPPDAFLVPGTRYYQARFAATSATVDDLVQDAENVLKADANSRPPSPALARYPDLADDATCRQFRSSGLERLGDLLLAALAQWIDGAPDIAENKIDKIVHYFLNRHVPRNGSGPAYKSLFETLRKAPSTAVAPERLDVLALKCLEQNSSVFQQENWREHPRWKLFSAAFAGYPAAILIWNELVAGGDHLPLPRKIENKLQELFPKTLTLQYIDAHCALSRQAPDLYGRLLERHFHSAVLMYLQFAPNALQELLSRHFFPSVSQSFFDALRRFVGALPPREGDVDHLLAPWPLSQKSQASLQAAHIFAAALECLWNNHLDNQVRDHLARWAPQFQSKGLDFNSMALRLAANEKVELNKLDLKEKWDWMEVPFLRDRIAARILHEPQSRVLYQDMRNHADVWGKYLGPAPRQARLLLLGECSSDATAGSEQEQAWTIENGALEEIACAWIADGTAHPCFSQAAQMFCDMSLPMNPQKNARTLQALRDLQTGEWAGNWQLEEDQVKNACALARAAGRLPGPDLRLRLWNAARAGWQLYLLLCLFPQDDFVPLPVHWTPLVSIRAWLEKEVSLKTGRLAPAFYDFYDPDSATRLSADEWKPEYENTILWAAFGKAPPSASPEQQERSMKEAFECYGVTDYGKAKCCRLFLVHRREKDAKDFDKHWKLAVSAFVVPALCHVLAVESGLLLLKDLLHTFGENRKKVGHSWSSEEWVLKLVYREAANAIHIERKEIQLADWMYTLLFEVCQGKASRLRDLIDLARAWVKKNPVRVNF
jgi:hypothetical protein